MNRRLISLLIVGAAAAPGRHAHAAPLGAVIADLEAPAELAVEAGAVSLLCRSMLGPGERTPVMRRDLVGALEALGATVGRQALSIDPPLAKTVLEQLGADRIFVGSMKVVDRYWQVDGQILGPDGQRLARVVATAAPGEAWALGRHVAHRIASRLGLAYVEIPETSLGPLRPFARASGALVAKDPAAAATFLQFADRTIATHVPGAQEIARAVWQNATVAPEARINTALLAGDAGAAAALSDEILQKRTAAPAGPPGAATRVELVAHLGKVRALVALKDVKGADAEMAKIPVPAEPDAAFAVASADLASASNAEDKKQKEEKALQVILKDPKHDVRPALAYIAPAPPHAYGPDVEQAAVNAARRVAGEDPGLASAVALRAAKGGVDLPASLPLVAPQDLTSSELKAVKTQVLAAGPVTPEGAHIGQELDERIVITHDLRIAAIGRSPSIPQAEPLVAALRDLLSRFDGLVSGSFSRVLIVGRKDSGQMPLWPVAVKPYRLHDGLLMTATDNPYELALAAPPSPDAALDDAMIVDGRLADLADEAGADVVIVHHIRPSGLSALVDLTLVDAATRKSAKAEAVMAAGLVGPNPVPLVVLAVAGLLVGLVFAMGWTRGNIVVRLKGESDVEEKYLSLLLSREATPPAVTDVAAHIESLRRTGHTQEELAATMVGHLTEFHRLPVGQWYVHLYGVYTRARIQRIVRGEAFTREVHLKRRKTLYIDFSLEAIAAEFVVSVLDDKSPVVGAKVWVDDDLAHAIGTARNGVCIVEVPRGKHVIHIEAKGLHVERPFEVVKLKPHELPINLVWERRVDDVSRALENSPESQAIADAIAGQVAESAGPDGAAQGEAAGAEEPLPVAEAMAEVEAEAFEAPAVAEALDIGLLPLDVDPPTPLDLSTPPGAVDDGISLADIGLAAPEREREEPAVVDLEEHSDGNPDRVPIPSRAGTRPA